MNKSVTLKNLKNVSLSNREHYQNVQNVIYLCAVIPTESDDMSLSVYGLSIEEEIR